MSEKETVSAHNKKEEKAYLAYDDEGQVVRLNTSEAAEGSEALILKCKDVEGSKGKDKPQFRTFKVLQDSVGLHLGGAKYSWPEEPLAKEAQAAIDSMQTIVAGLKGVALDKTEAFESNLFDVCDAANQAFPAQEKPKVASSPSK